MGLLGTIILGNTHMSGLEKVFFVPNFHEQLVYFCVSHLVWELFVKKMRPKSSEDDESTGAGF